MLKILLLFSMLLDVAGKNIQNSIFQCNIHLSDNNTVNIFTNFGTYMLCKAGLTLGDFVGR